MKVDEFKKEAGKLLFAEDVEDLCFKWLKSNSHEFGKNDGEIITKLVETLEVIMR